MTIADYIHQFNSDKFKTLPEITEIPEYLRRYSTGNAIDSLAKKFDLPNTVHMQDWEYEVADPGRIDEFLNAYLSGELDDDERFTIAETIIESFSMLKDPLRESATWEKFLLLIEKNRKIHLHTIHYWSLENYQEVADDIADYEIHFYFRVLWEKYKSEFIDKEKDEAIRLYKSTLTYDQIKMALEEQTKYVDKQQFVHHFNPKGYLAYHSSSNLKNSVIKKPDVTPADIRMSPMWKWVINLDQTVGLTFDEARKSFSQEAEEQLGIPKSLVVLFEEFYGIFSKLHDQKTAQEKLINIYVAITPGRDLSDVLLQYQHWLLSSFTIPKLDACVTNIATDIKAYSKLVAELLNEYLCRRLTNPANIAKIKSLIRDWGYVLDEKKIKAKDLADHEGYILQSSIAVANNISVMLDYGASVIEWAIRVSPGYNPDDEKKHLEEIYQQLLSMLRT